MKKFVYGFTASMLILSACSPDSPGYKKGEGGMEYKIIADGSGPTLQEGDFIQLHVSMEYKDKVKDTVMTDSRQMIPEIVPLDKRIPAGTLNVLKMARRGDSLVMRILTDSAFKMGQMDPFMTKGGMIYTKVKILNIFKSQDEVDSANMAEIRKSRPMIKQKENEDFNKKLTEFENNLAADKQLIDKDSKIIEAYLAKNNIKATRTKWGTYIAVHTEGTGELLNAQSVASVNYTGKTLDSMITFDSNTDPKFSHVQPYQVSIGPQLGSVVIGWTDALLHMKNGEKATIYLPSSLGYGMQGRPPHIKPMDILMFDMEIVKVQTEDDLMEEAIAQRKKNKEREQEIQDSLKKAK